MGANGMRGTIDDRWRKVRGVVAAFVLPALVCVDAQAQHETGSDIVEGSRAFQNVCANCHGPDGDLIVGIDLGRGVLRQPYSDDELVAIILEGIPNTPMPPTLSMSEPQAREIVSWLRATAAARPEQSLPGDVARGQSLFEGAGDCRSCHAVAGIGSRTGPDLTDIGQRRRSAELEIALLDPDAEVQPENRVYRVVQRNGEAVVGRLLNHDTFSVQLIDETERLRSFDKTALREFGFIASTMPAYGERFDAQQIADLVSYMATLRGMNP